MSELTNRASLLFISNTFKKRLFRRITAPRILNVSFSQIHVKRLSRMLGLATLCVNLQKTTLPPLDFSLQPAAFFLWLRSGSWLTPTRGDPDCHVTERSWLGKGDRVISRARSINWGVSGACGRLDKRDLKAQRFPASRFPLKT